MMIMIRIYDPRLDEAEVVRLIRTELIPLSHTVHQLDAQTIRELPKRFRRGVTYVASLSKKARQSPSYTLKSWVTFCI